MAERGQSELVIWMVVVFFIGMVIIYIMFNFAGSEETGRSIDDMSKWLSQEVLHFLGGPRLPVQ